MSFHGTNLRSHDITTTQAHRQRENLHRESEAQGAQHRAPTNAPELTLITADNPSLIPVVNDNDDPSNIEVVATDRLPQGPSARTRDDDGVLKSPDTVHAENNFKLKLRELVQAAQPMGVKHMTTMGMLGFVGLLIPFGTAGALNFTNLQGWDKAVAYAATASVVDKTFMKTLGSLIPQGSINPKYLADWNAAMDAFPDTFNNLILGTGKSDSPIGVADFAKAQGKHFLSEMITMAPFFTVLNMPNASENLLANWAIKDVLGLGLMGAAAFMLVQAGRSAFDIQSYQPSMDEVALKLRRIALQSYRGDIQFTINNTADAATVTRLQKLLDKTDESIRTTDLALQGKVAVMKDNLYKMCTTQKGLTEVLGRIACLLTSPTVAAAGATGWIVPAAVVFGFMARDHFDKVVLWGFEESRIALRCIDEMMFPPTDNEVFVMPSEVGRESSSDESRVRVEEGEQETAIDLTNVLPDDNQPLSTVLGIPKDPSSSSGSNG